MTSPVLIAPAATLAGPAPSLPAAFVEHVDVVARWRLGPCVALRWCVVYFGIYVLSTQMIATLVATPVGVPYVPQLGLLPPLRTLVEWSRRTRSTSARRW